MNRRNALKKLGALGLIASTSLPVMASEKEEFCDVYKKYSPKIHNRNFMKIKDPKNPTKGELKHTPEIKIGAKDNNGYTIVEITIGQNGIIHPSSENHWIDFIELDADGKLVARTAIPFLHIFFLSIPSLFLIFSHFPYIGVKH